MIMNQKRDNSSLTGIVDDGVFKLALKLGLIPTLDENNDIIIYNRDFQVVVDGRVLP